MEKQQSVTKVQIAAAKVALDTARRLKDALKTELAEAALNDLLDRYTYHGYHGSHQEGNK